MARSKRKKRVTQRERERERERERDIKTTCYSELLLVVAHCSELTNIFRFGIPNLALFQFFVVWDAQIVFLLILQPKN